MKGPMDTKEPKQITSAEMAAILDGIETRRGHSMSPATRHVLLTGQSTFVDSDGQEYRCPTIADDGPTHTLYAAVDPVATNGEDPCKLS